MRKPFAPGTKIRVEFNAVVVGLVDQENPFWYVCQFPDGHIEEISLARINQIQDRSRGVIDTDGSMQIFSPRLSAAGGLDLLEWLRTNEAELRAAAGITPLGREVSPIVHKQYAPDGSNYHDHLCRCPGCAPQPPDKE